MKKFLLKSISENLSLVGRQSHGTQRGKAGFDMKFRDSALLN
jgi:hypothetical protein